MTKGGGTSHTFTFYSKDGKQYQEGVMNNMLPFVGKRERATAVEA